MVKLEEVGRLRDKDPLQVVEVGPNNVEATIGVASLLNFTVSLEW